LCEINPDEVQQWLFKTCDSWHMMNDLRGIMSGIEYQKSHSFRVVHADGAYGGTSPRLQLFIAFYSERFPIPKVLTYEASPAGAPLDEIVEARESKEGVIREVEVGVTMDINAAKGFAAWLNERVAELEKARLQVLGENLPTEIQK
jgi:hypothetical protein